MSLYIVIHHKISIHTPARGVTPSDRLLTAVLIISIHTPARGVTIDVFHALCITRISIHTPARGVTLIILECLCCHVISIHTPARGVTSNTGYQSAATNTDFNPHSRKGSDVLGVYFASPQIISIHTPARGVTQSRDRVRCP